jgi:hypothetical protein
MAPGSKALGATAEEVWVARPDQQNGMNQLNHSNRPR